MTTGTLTNYDATVIGSLRCRVPRITVEFPANGLPELSISQSTAVTLLGGETQEIITMPTLSSTIDLINNANTPIPLVDYDTGKPLLDANGVQETTTLNAVMIQMLAIIRQVQNQNNP